MSEQAIPTISCMCVTRHRVPLLRRAVDCFREQTHPKLELLIVFESDDDATRDFVASLNDDRVRGIEVAVSPKQSLGALRNLAVAEARLYAEALEPRCVNLLAGIAPEKLGLDACRATLIENTRYAAEAFAPLGVRVVVEAINTNDRPGFFLASSAAALDLIDAVGHPNLGLQYDLYHMHIMEGALIETLTRLIGRIAHIQFADAPGRHEPGTGDIDFAAAFATIDALGYDGWVAAEYVPSKRTEETLHWLPNKE